MKRVSKLMNGHKAGGVLLLGLVIAVAKPATAQMGSATNGQKVFQEKCEKCHGKDGSGNTGFGKALKAADLRSIDVQKKADADFYTQIAQGKKNMPAFGTSLNKSQINDAIAYVREFGKKYPEVKK